MKEKTYDLFAFQKLQAGLVAKNDSSWNRFDIFYNRSYREFSDKEIEDILKSSSLSSQQELSRAYYDKNGFYKRILLYYATLLTYTGLLIPNPSSGSSLSKSQAKKYRAVLEYLENLSLPELLTKITLKILIYGSYYGILHTLNKDECVILDLPISYTRSRFKDVYGNEIVEFNVNYFNTIFDEEDKKEALRTYPKIISDYYKRYEKGKVSTPWVFLPAETGVCFSFLDDCRPLFLDIIPSTIQYDDSVDTERDREEEEIRKIIVQKIPHLSDGQLLFEPDEVLEMHKGAVGMMKGNKNLSVLTTYGDVDAIISKTASESVSNALEKMLQNVYANAGVSSQLFAPTGSQSLMLSIKNDLSLMMMLGNKYSRFITYIINNLFGNGSLSFRYSLLPLTEYTRSDFITDSMKLAQGGYSLLLPALGMGLNQLELISIKDLENTTLNLKEKLIPLSSSYTESSGKVGAPEKKPEDKAKKTIQNEESLDHQGDSE